MAAKYRLKLGEEQVDVEIEDGPEGPRARIGRVWHKVSFERIGDSAQYSLIIDGSPVRLFAEETPHGYQILIGGRSYSVATGTAATRAPAETVTAAAEAPGEEWVVLSLMAGVVQKVLVAPDDFVEPGDILMIIEAMKMQNELRARRAGQVKAVYVTAGQQVEQGTPLLVLL
ncbi:MAG: biotin/lipoyl-containing protein [Dehalococcoidia bacterium]|jgi:biotin carboxyl carrier protein